MPQGNKVWFVTWPDGKIDQETLNVFGKQWAIAAFIGAFLPERWFGRIDWVASSWGAYGTLWKNAEERGFKVHEIDVTKLPGLVDGKVPPPPQGE